MFLAAMNLMYNTEDIMTEYDLNAALETSSTYMLPGVLKSLFIFFYFNIKIICLFFLQQFIQHLLKLMYLQICHQPSQTLENH